MTGGSSMNTLGSRIRSARELRGYSQAQLSTALGSSTPSLVTNWEKGISKPDVDKLAKLCRILDVSPSIILGLEEPQTELTSEEIALIRKLRNIDDHGRSLVSSVVTHEYQRCKAASNPKSFPKKDDELSPIFLHAGDPDYSEMKERTASLSSLRKEAEVSVEGILRFLWSAGYVNLSIMDILMTLDVKKVPSKKLYTFIYAFLTKKYQVVPDENLFEGD